MSANSSLSSLPRSVSRAMADSMQSLDKQDAPSLRRGDQKKLLEDAASKDMDWAQLHAQDPSAAAAAAAAVEGGQDGAESGPGYVSHTEIQQQRAQGKGKKGPEDVGYISSVVTGVVVKNIRDQLTHPEDVEIPLSGDHMVRKFMDQRPDLAAQQAQPRLRDVQSFRVRAPGEAVPAQAGDVDAAGSKLKRSNSTSYEFESFVRQEHTDQELQPIIQQQQQQMHMHPGQAQASVVSQMPSQGGQGNGSGRSASRLTNGSLQWHAPPPTAEQQQQLLMMQSKEYQQQQQPQHNVSTMPMGQPPAAPQHHMQMQQQQWGAPMQNPGELTMGTEDRLRQAFESAYAQQQEQQRQQHQQQFQQMIQMQQQPVVMHDAVHAAGQPMIAVGDPGKSNTRKSRKTTTLKARRARRQQTIKYVSKDGQVVVPDPAILRSDETIVYSRHEDFLAKDEKTYYVPDLSTKRRMCSVIPCYNEDADALRRTLQTLAFQQDNLDKLGFDFHAVVIMDGWQLTSESMRMYLQTVFDMPENAEYGAPTWWEDLNDVEGSPPVETFIVQHVNTTTWSVAPVQIEPEIDPDCKMKLTLMIKRDNRRKHNTLEWFLRSFSVEYGAEYGFTTDCGTLFEEDTIYHLANHLDLFPRCGGVTGRQRVMTAQQQGLERESWYCAWMRAVQGYEYEATFASYVGAFSMTGMLPVIPGPCGLFNMKHLNGDGVQFFFDKVKQDPDTAGLLLGNGLLAEDRFLSYAAVVSTHKPTITEFVPESVFYFEAETELKTFVAQRRRWNNGTFACFVWLMLNLNIIRDTPHGFLFKFMMQFLVIWQCVWLAFSLLAPAIFILLLRLALRHTFPTNEMHYSFWADMVSVGYIVLYVAFIVEHSKSKFEAWLFHTFTLLHMFAVVFIIGTFIDATIKNRDTVVTLTLYLFAVYQGSPVVLSLIISPRSCVQLTKFFLPYMLFLPTHTMTFWTYALTRTFDLTWGNRPTTHKVPKHERNLIVDTLKDQAMSLIALVTLCNFIFAVILLQVANSGAMLQIIWVLVGTMVFAGVQMTLSFLFAIEYHIIRRIRRWIRGARMRSRRTNAKRKRKFNASAYDDVHDNPLEWDNTGLHKHGSGSGKSE
eukprot:m.179654 g.179654  ORF g.179654 m.179654 type:complete len:1110 (+) comp14644_c0_seq1:809-4138(+)